jgi:hypothetical protein
LSTLLSFADRVRVEHLSEAALVKSKMPSHE